MPGGYYKTVLQWGKDSKLKIRWWGRWPRFSVAIPGDVNPSYVKYPPGFHEQRKRGIENTRMLRVDARKIALDKRAKYTDKFHKCPTIYLRLDDGSYAAQVETDKFGRGEDIWTESFLPIRAVPQFNLDHPDKDPGPKYTGERQQDMELMLGYYLFAIRVHHHLAFQQLFWKPSWYTFFPIIGPEHIKKPPWLQHYPIFIYSWRYRDPETSDMLDLVLRRNDIYNGLYHPYFDGKRLYVRATLEVIAALAFCAGAYYAVPWAYKELNKEDYAGTTPHVDIGRPPSDFDRAHRSMAQTSQQPENESLTREPSIAHAPTKEQEAMDEQPTKEQEAMDEQPTSRWAQIRSAMSKRG